MSFGILSAPVAAALKAQNQKEKYVSTNEYGHLVFIGRFQPFHNGHKRVIDTGLLKAHRLIILIGSSNSARCYRNPFTFEERKHMILNAYPEEVKERLVVLPLNDLAYNDQSWIKLVQRTVKDAILSDINRETPNCHLHGLNDTKVGLIGHSRDHTSYYLNLFPEWGNIDVPQRVVYNATDIRKQYFTSTPRIPPAILPKSTFQFLTDFLETDSFSQIYSEYEYVETYKKAWANAPYDPVFVTVDAIVIQAGHILVVRRRAMPGKGLMALPGGFVDKGEKINDAVFRELREETKIKVPEKVLRGSVRKQRVFDDPNRSSRGRTITHAFLIELEPAFDLPKVKGGSDATKAEWIQISDLKANEMFEDHYHIVQNMIGDM